MTSFKKQLSLINSQCKKYAFIDFNNNNDGTCLQFGHPSRGFFEPMLSFYWKFILGVSKSKSNNNKITKILKA